jgi:DNA primase
VDHPDELRVDLDPTPGSSDWSDVRRVAMCVREVLEEHGLTGYPKTSGPRGIHIRTIASAYSVRPNPDACVSAPLGWDEVPDAELGDFRLDTVPARLKERGDPSAGLHKNRRLARAACSTWPRATRPGGSATRPGRRTSPSRRASRSGSSSRGRRKAS